jgi:hypothetical protein
MSLDVPDPSPFIVKCHRGPYDQPGRAFSTPPD